jgi:asparagine synthase (glutamine-hydrolysing)
LAPGRVTAITAIPRQGGAGAPTATHFFDEGPSAAATAAHLGIAHRQVDGGIPSEQLSALRAMQRWHHQPILSGYGPGWWQQIGSVAAEMDAHVILTGQLGNYTLSLGGVTALADLRQESGWHAYLSLVRPLARLYPLRTILNQSLSPGVRARIADLRQPPSLDQQLWKRPLHSGRPFTEPAHTAFRERALELLATDLVDRTVFALHGVELAHPVASRELAEFCLRLPLTDLVGGDGGRPLFEAAFGDLLPEGMLREQRRGMQGADWWIGLSPQALRDEVELLARYPLVRDTINLNRVDDYLRAWPMDFAAAQRVEHQYRFMLRTVSAAMFIAENF